MKPDQIAAIFDATDAEFAELSPVLWDPIGAATVKAAEVRQGDRVLDVCCGAGAAAIPAAVTTGPTGAVHAIDLAGSLLAQGRRRAATHGLRNVRFVNADATTWTTDTPYDVALCVHGVYFLPDMDGSVTRLTGLLTPGGRFAVTTWARGALEEYAKVLRAAVEKARGAPVPAPSGSASFVRISTEQGLAGWLTERGLDDVRVTQIPMSVSLTPELAWLLVTGSGFRGMLTGLDAATVSAVRTDLLTGLRAAGVDEVDTSILIGVGVTPVSGAGGGG
ncbi:class I SAM-dependent methyltransferase [Sphaerisporangium sp. B11E5]|uniref:class I SAM-dependent methyltransferase n=1 Tax=Sphaerisporangium sp. B11E5 TaxID=3153563 RepID=UPI00325F8523